MLASALPRLSRQRITKFLTLSGSLLALGALAACGGGSSSQVSTGGGGGGGGGGGNPIANVCTTGAYSGTAGSGPQPNPFFGMHIHALEPNGAGDNGTPWPGTITLSNASDAVTFGGLRLWDSGTGWADINTSAGVCDFSHMDSWLQEAQSNNADVLYDLARTPNWASSNPTDSTCSYTGDGGDGQCDPPSDLNTDGSGADSIWIGWVTSVATRYKGQIKYYEIWNEWNISNFWVGSIPQLVRMTQDAYCVVEGPPSGGCNPNSTFPSGTGIDPSAKIITPAPVGSANTLNAAGKNMNLFLGTQLSSNAGGQSPANFVDVIGFHCYVGTPGPPPDYPVPEQVLTVINDLNNVLPAYGLQNNPVFCTEGSWSNTTDEGFTDPDLQAGFLARFYLLQNPTNVSRVYWYAWDSTSTDPGTLWNSSTGQPVEAATAYAEIYKWITGATATACAVNGTIWTCSLTRTGGYQAEAVWDGNTASSCYTDGAPACGTTIAVPSGYTLSRDLTGAETAVTAGSNVALSAKPILLETSTLP